MNDENFSEAENEGRPGFYTEKPGRPSPHALFYLLCLLFSAFLMCSTELFYNGFSFT